MQISMARLRSAAFLLFSSILGGLCSISQGLRLTAVKVPSVAVAGQNAVLECRYALQGDDVLYAVKWYKDSDEFYRYVLAEKAPITFFPLPGIVVNLAESNDTRVTLQSVDLNTSATFRCEVSAEAPSFQTVSRMANMTVIRVAGNGPFIIGLKEDYSMDDELDLNCTFPPLALETGPQLRLNWHLNYQPFQSIDWQPPANWNKNPWLNLKFRLSKEHLDPSGKLHVSCIATLGTNFRRSTEGWTKLRPAVQSEPFPTQQLRTGRERSASYASGSTTWMTSSWTPSLLMLVCTAYISF